MNRRSLLRMLGLAPVAACSAALPAMALPKPENVKETVKSAIDKDYAIGSSRALKAADLHVRQVLDQPSQY